MNKNDFRGFRFLFLVVLTLGVLVRFVNLDGKVYWHDETYTSLRISGYTSTEVSQKYFQGQVIEIEDLQQYQRPNPEKSWGDILKALARDNPQHPPLYYLMARFWVQIFGHSVAGIRSLSAFISLLVFPALYWLCWELFEVQSIKNNQPIKNKKNLSFKLPQTNLYNTDIQEVKSKIKNPVGWVAIALLAVSPFHVLYAQEAREYALWTVTILLSSAALLRAQRWTPDLALFNQKNYLNWGLYTVTLAAGFYTFLFTGFVAIAHGIYVAIESRFRFTKTVTAYALASSIAILAFLPWIRVAIANFEQIRNTTSWTEEFTTSNLNIVRSFFLNTSRIFWDIGWNSEHSLTLIIEVFTLMLLGYSIYVLVRTATPKTYWFILLMLATVLCLLLPDLIWGGVRSLSPRYLIPCFLGTHIVVAYGLSNSKKIGVVFAIGLVCAGLISCAVLSQTNTSRTKVVSYSLPQVASLVNTANSPLLIGNDFGINRGNIIALSYLLEDKVKLQLFEGQNLPQISNDFSTVFFLNPSNSLRQKLEQEQDKQLEWVFEDNHLHLWKVK